MAVCPKAQGPLTLLDLYGDWPYVCNITNHTMYTLDCSYYTKSFATIDALINDIMISGMDPNYPIMLNGEHTGEMAIDLIQF